jgi:hypothetical protein
MEISLLEHLGSVIYFHKLYSVLRFLEFIRGEMFKTEKGSPTVDKICIEFINQLAHFDDCKKSTLSSNDCEMSPNETGNVLYILDNRYSASQMKVL